MKNQLSWIVLCIGLITSCSLRNQVVLPVLESPSGNIKVQTFLNSDNQPAYQVFFNNKLTIDTSLLGFELKDAPALNKNFTVTGFDTASFSETWEQPWGEQQKVVNKYHELTIHLKEAGSPGRMMDLIFRAFDDGIGFRYSFPKQAGFSDIYILNENTQFKMTANHQSWWSPGDWDGYEHLYSHTRISQIDAKSKNDKTLYNCTIPENAVHTPFTMQTDDGTFISIHEANLTDYACMTLIADTTNLTLKSDLVSSERLGYAVHRELPFKTPWRTIQLATKPGDLITSMLILNLNEPNKLGDVSWVKPAKYNGIWWEMHLGISGWDMEGGKHGATTANAKKYIDFAAANNLQAVLVEGWNTGWDRWTGAQREGVFDFVTPYADYNLPEVVAYAKSKDIEVIMHHETSAAPRTYEYQMDTAYRLMQKLGLHTAKLGYVGKIIPEGEHQNSQWMVNHYQKAIETSAKCQVAVNIHEPVKPTGLRRTYPNLISGEGVRGQEFNAWALDGGNPPSHLTIVPFTRMLAGPIDYTPGIFDIKLKPYRPNNQVNNTLANQLALYVIIYSPVQMAADLPKNYENQPAFQFIRDVAVDWKQTLVLDAQIGEFVTIARQARNSDNWFVGTITNEKPRTVTLDFNFLDKDKTYQAIIYKDGKDADYVKNPTSYTIEKMVVTQTTKISVDLAAGGGAAISLMPVKAGKQ